MKIQYLWLLVLIFSSWKRTLSLTIYNDLSYQDSEAVEEDPNIEDSQERKWLLLEDIQSLASFLIHNITQLCPLNEQKYLHFVDKVIRNTLANIYERDETLERFLFYEKAIPVIKKTLNTCIQHPSSRITIQEFFEREFPETILHLDLMRDAYDSTKWYNFRQCIRTGESTKFYPGTVPSIMDTFWSSFLIGYFGCLDFWINLDAWTYLDTVSTTILLPIHERWSSKFPTQPPFSATTTLEPKNLTKKRNSPKLKLRRPPSKDTEVLPVSTNVSSIEYLINSLEKCNVILFWRNPSDPIPCFKDVL